MIEIVDGVAREYAWINGEWVLVEGSPWNENTCAGCGHDFDLSHHVSGVKACCPDCSHFTTENREPELPNMIHHEYRGGKPSK